MKNFEKVFEECNENFREADRKRDQIMVFYTLVVSALLSSLDKLGEIEKAMSLNLINPIIIIIILLGFILSIVLIHFRKWHLMYSYTATLLLKLEMKPERKNAYDETINKYIEQQYRKLGINKSTFLSSDWFFKYYPNGIEFYTYNAFLIVTFIPLYILMSFFIGEFSNLIFLFLIFIAYLFVMNLFAAITLYNEFIENSPIANWIISGLRDNQTKKKKNNLISRINKSLKNLT